MDSNHIDSNHIDRVASVLRVSLWNKGEAAADREVFRELENQTVAALAGPVLSSISLPADLEQEWKRVVFTQVLSYDRYLYVQSMIPVSVPYVILKGTAASRYYPYPEYRVMGDIDIITHHEDFNTAYQEFLDNGYVIIKEELREVGFEKDGIEVELHRSFSKFNDPQKSKYLDDLIIENINDSHYLPFVIDGLVLIEHINQHMENGLGLRQIIDWMMYVDRHLSDEEWKEFRPLVQKIGLEKLAVTVTKMCQLYLGLPERAWCSDADDQICRQLMEYLLVCGNFGRSQSLDSRIATRAYGFSHTLTGTFKIMQRNGLRRWKLAAKYPALRPFAWLYQIAYYIRMVLFRRNAIPKLIEEYREGVHRTLLFDQLGVKQTSKGNIIYSDGKYVKE